MGRPPAGKSLTIGYFGDKAIRAFKLPQEFPLEYLQLECLQIPSTPKHYRLGSTIDSEAPSTRNPTRSELIS